MNTETVGLLGGLLFILIAIVGGGFTIKEIQIPTVPRWARIVSVFIGLVFIYPFLRNTIFPPSVPNQAIEDRANSAPGICYSDSTPDISPQSIKLTQIEVRCDHNPPRVDDRITITFSMQNVSGKPIKFAEVFVGARDANKKHHNYGYSHKNETIQTNSTITTKADIIVDGKGIWDFWPCYTLDDTLCPDEWRVFHLPVE